MPWLGFKFKFQNLNKMVEHKIRSKINLALEWVKLHEDKILKIEKQNGFATDDKVLTIAILYKGFSKPKAVLRKSLLFDSVWEVELPKIFGQSNLIDEELQCNWFLKSWRTNANAFYQSEIEERGLSDEHRFEVLMKKKMLD